MQTNKRYTIVISSDHNGIVQKAKVKSQLQALGHIVIDFGPYSEHGKVDYNFFAGLVGKSISAGDADRGILICGTGVGMSIVANRYKSVRAVLAHNEMTAEKSREHNDANVLCLGSWISSEVELLKLTTLWLSNEWAEGRHSKRVHMIDTNNGLTLTNGVFDLLHRGHIDLLKFAKAQGERLVVALDSDNLVRKTKGSGRPINNEEDRKSLLEALEFIDEVLIFDCPKELQELYSQIKPATIVKGAEWTAEEVRERDGIPDFIEVKVFPVVGEFSTTSAISRIKES
ncbi:RpiB/LacA/LacB family sugar-phosphate isomerase [Alphaproteobacteria bacterium]|nr:RpiB/LacA/LacB family sugar-phosphate isomerase [Alphaproteobacteria bacterium]